jgi:hypothetical protein
MTSGRTAVQAAAPLRCTRVGRASPAPRPRRAAAAAVRAVQHQHVITVDGIESMNLATRICLGSTNLQRCSRNGWMTDARTLTQSAA